jgi:hypothetical protein
MNNFVNYRGDDFVLNLAFTSGGVAQNITGWTILMTLKPKKSLGDNDSGVIKVTGVITNGAGGLATLTMASTVTDDLLGSYYYDIQYKDTAGVIKTFSDGIITFLEDITIRTSA